jgi:hypothetical protein
MFDALRGVPFYPKVSAYSAVIAAATLVGAGAFPDWSGWYFGGVAAAGLLVTVGLTVLGDQLKAKALKSMAWIVGLAAVAFAVGGIAVVHDGDLVVRVIAGAAGGLFVAGSVVWYLREVMEPGTTKAKNERRNRRAQSVGNAAGRLDIWEKASRSAMRHQIRTTPLRPSLQKLSRWQQLRTAPSEFGVHLVYVGAKWLRGVLPWRDVYAGWRQTTYLIGTPGSGKTGYLANIAFNAPGALILLSTRSDLLAWVYEKRLGVWQWENRARRLVRWALRKGPAPTLKPTKKVFIWNPTNYIQAESNIYWSVLAGCDTIDGAAAAATDHIPVIGESGSAEVDEWRTHARNHLKNMMYAAELSGRNMLAVLDWNGQMPNDKKTCRARQEIEAAVMKGDPETARVILAELEEHYNKPPRTLGSVTHTVTQALKWLSNPKARLLGDSPREMRGSANWLDIRELIEGHHTLFIAGHERQPELAPLNARLLGELNDQIRRIAGEKKNERHDPPISIVGDEAWASRMPFAEMSADMGGRGVFLITSWQSFAQMDAKMGLATAAEYRGNVNNAMVMALGNDSDELRKAAALFGTARFKNVGEQNEAADSHRWAPLIDEAALRAMDEHEAACNRFGLPPILGRTIPIWDVPGVRKADDLFYDIDVPDTVEEAEAGAATVEIPVQAEATEVQS